MLDIHASKMTIVFCYSRCIKILDKNDPAWEYVCIYHYIHSESQKGEPGSKGNVGPTGAEGIKG